MNIIIKMLFTLEIDISKINEMMFLLHHLSNTCIYRSLKNIFFNLKEFRTFNVLNIRNWMNLFWRLSRWNAWGALSTGDM